MASESLVIYASRTKTVGLILIGAVFMALGVWFISLDAAEVEPQHGFNYPALIHGLGYVTVAFFGLCLVAATWRLFSRKPGLALSSEGIAIYSMTDDVFIPWQDVAGLATFEVHGQKMLVLMLQEPEKYIETGGIVRRRLARASYRLCGSPIAVSSNSLQADFTELRELCARYVNRYASGA